MSTRPNLLLIVPPGWGRYWDEPLAGANVRVLIEGQDSFAPGEAGSSLLVGALRAMGLACDLPRATFYVWAEVPKGYTSVSFTERVLKEAGVAITPGSGFGKGGEGFVRFSLTVPDQRLRENGLDFAHQAVRDYMFGIVGEASERYDCDGLEMDFNRFTEKLQEGFHAAQSLASQRGQQQLDVEHLLVALLEQQGGLAPSILSKAQAHLETVHARLMQELDRLDSMLGL